MRRLHYLLFSLFLLPCLAKAQTTNITLQVTDAGGQSWNNGTWSTVLASAPGAIPAGPPFSIIGTSTSVPNQSQNGALSGTGSATMTLTQNAFIAPVSSRWNFTVCAQTTAINNCFTQFVVVTATTTVTLTPPALVVNPGPSAQAYVDAELSGAVVGSVYYNVISNVQRICNGPAPCTWGSSSTGAGVVVVPSSATPTFTTTSNGQPFAITDFFMVLTQNVTSSTIAGTFKQGDEIVVTLQQNVTGGWTFVWPAGFLNTPTLQLGANAYTAMTFQFCGTVGNAACPANNWQATDIGSSGVIPASPTTPNNVPQILTSTPIAGVGGASTWGLGGITGRAVTGTTANDTITSTDCNNDVDYQGSVSVSPVTIPTATTLGVAGCVLVFHNDTTGVGTTLTISPSAWQVKVNGAAAVSSFTVAKGQRARLLVDAAGSLWDAELADFTSSQTPARIITADWTCGTGGVNTSCVAAQTISTLTFTLPLIARNWTIDCNGVVGQATAATANSWNIQTATNGATSFTASYSMNTAATAMTGGATTDVASTTTTTVIGPTWTLGGTGTKMPFHIWATIEGASAFGSVVNIQLVAPTVGDLVTIYRGAACFAY